VFQRHPLIRELSGLRYVRYRANRNASATNLPALSQRHNRRDWPRQLQQ
jgi:hypothetical protein